jgi:hypothetical protein
MFYCKQLFFRLVRAIYFACASNLISYLSKYIYNFIIIYREEMDTHLESMQNELDNLRDVLRNEGYSINANAILGVNIMSNF